MTDAPLAPCPWQPIAAADRTPVVGLRSATIIGCDAAGNINKTFCAPEHPKGDDWLIGTGSGLEAWKPILWVPLPEAFQDKGGMSFEARQLLAEVNVECPTCDGMGEWDEGPLISTSSAQIEPVYRRVVCEDCDGSGQVTADKAHILEPRPSLPASPMPPEVDALIHKSMPRDFERRYDVVPPASADLVEVAARAMAKVYQPERRDVHWRDYLSVCNVVLAAVTPLIAAQAREDADEYGWLIEHEDEPKWLTLEPGEASYEVCWTTTASEALRFCRRVDAENYVSAHFGGEGPFRVTDHIWHAIRALKGPQT